MLLRELDLLGRVPGAIVRDLAEALAQWHPRRLPRSRLEAHDDFEDLMLLRELDLLGRVPGAIVRDLAEALDFIRDMDDD